MTRLNMIDRLKKIRLRLGVVITCADFNPLKTNQQELPSSIAGLIGNLMSLRAAILASKKGGGR